MRHRLFILQLYILIFTIIAPAKSLAVETNAPAASQVSQENINDPFLAPRNSIGYQTLIFLSAELKDITFKVYDGVATIISPLLYLVTALTVLGVIVSYIINKPPNYVTVLSIFIVILLLRELAFNSSQFDFFIYHPLEKIMFGLPAIIMQTVFTGKFTALSANPLEDIFMQMDATIGVMANVSEKIMDNISFASHSSIWIKALLLQFTYMALQIGFSYMFLIAIWALHMLLALVPIALCMAVHSATRKYIYNIIHYTALFLIVPAIATIAMTITITMLRNITKTAELLAKETASINDFPEDFFWHAMFLGVISLCFHLKTTAIAGMIVGSIGYTPKVIRTKRQESVT